jgi:hypothetical protein
MKFIMAQNNNNNSNDLLVPEAQNALQQMKLEIAAELGIENYDGIDKGALSARDNGRIGGEMTRRLVAMAQAQLTGQPEVTSSTITGEERDYNQVESYVVDATNIENSEFLQ